MFRFCCLVMASLALSNQAKALDKIVMWDKSYNRPAMLELVTLAADLTIEQYGPYELQPSMDLEEGRAFTQLIKNQDVNLAIGGVTQQRETTTLPVYFPLTRGLLGFRLCLVNQQRANAFIEIETVEDFSRAQLTIGLGTHWPDKEIIEHNKLQIVTNPVFSRLFDMLSKNRFDCFLRGIGELEYELDAYPTEQLMTEEHIAFIYPLANFIFISPQESRLQKRIEQGLLIAKQNGQFAEHFEKHYRPLMQLHKFYERKLFILRNPNLSEKAIQAINQYGIASFAN